MDTRFALFALSLLALALLFAGCASEQPAANPNGSAQPAPAGNQQGNTGTGGIGGNVTTGGEQVPVIDNNPQGQNNSPSQSGSSCDVGFQLSSSDVYLTKVNFQNPVSGLVEVQCPDGSLGIDKGSNLFLCEKLTSGSTVTAFLDGSKCGSASFNAGSSPSAPSQTPSVSSCTLRVQSSAIIAGDSAIFDITSSTPKGANVVLDCGSDQIQVESGVVEKTTSCQFTSAGDYDAVLYVDSKECARASVHVVPRSALPKSCSVNTTKKDFANHRFDGTVTYAGFNSTSVLKWDCWGASYTTQLGSPGGLVGESATGSINIFCQYTAPSAVALVPVSIDNVACGSLEVR